MKARRSLPADTAAPAVVDYVPAAGVPEAENRALLRVLNENADASAVDALDLAGSPELLHRLEGFPPDHPYRAGIRWKVYELPPAGAPSYVRFDWTAQLPTEEFLAELLEAGTIRCTRLVVRGFLRNRALPAIRVALTPTRRPESAADPRGDRALDLVERMLPALGAGSTDLAGRVAALEERLEKLEAWGEQAAAALNKQATALEQLSTFVSSAVAQLAQRGDMGGLAQTVREFRELFGGAPAAENRPPAKAPTSPGGGVVM